MFISVRKFRFSATPSPLERVGERSKLQLPIFYLLLLFAIVGCKQNEPEATSKYITKVFEYVYAPGQHASIANIADSANFVGEPKTDKWVYLGGFGGYIIAGFDHNVKNETGADFEVYALAGQAPEPAIVYVMSDTNADGLPNETWYELKGSQFDNSQRNYWVCYHKATTDTTNITWTDSKGNAGELVSGFGGASSAKWWWKSTAADSIKFEGTRLPDAYDLVSSNWVVPVGRFAWGYAENLQGTDYEKATYANKLDIANAVDSTGNAVVLPHIRFIKVQSAVFQQAGRLNEVSSEVRGAKSLR